MIKIDYEGCWKELKDFAETEKEEHIRFKNRTEFKELITEIEKLHSKELIGKQAIDYESIWKEVQKTDFHLEDAYKLKVIEEKHIRDFVELKRRTPEDLECYWRKLYFKKIIELAELKKKLEDVKKAIE